MGNDIRFQGNVVIGRQDQDGDAQIYHVGIGHIQGDNSIFQVIAKIPDAVQAAGKNEPGILQGIGAEEHPCEAYFEKGKQKGEKTALLLWPDTYFQNLINAMDSAPYDIVDARPVPESADQEGKNQVQAMAEGSFAAASQRNIHIIPEPGGKGNMPAAPEFTDAAGKVGAFEVLLQINSEELGTADGNIRISGEITIDLDREHNGGDREN